MLWVRVPPEPFTSRPRGAVRSARHPVTVEIVGSNPIEDAATNAEVGMGNVEVTSFPIPHSEFHNAEGQVVELADTRRSDRRAE